MKRILLLASFAGTLAAQSVTGVIPNQTTAGVFSADITVNGSGFGTGSVIFFLPPGTTARQQLATALVNANQLTATIPYFLLSNPGAATVDVQNAGGPVSNAVPFTINPPVALPPDTLPPASIGVPYSKQIIATGGTGARTFSISSGSLPANLTMSSSGLITGIPVTAGLSSFVILVADSVGSTNEASFFSISVAPALVIGTTSLPNTTIGTLYSSSAAVTGGTGLYTFSLSAGSLPPGLSIGSGGTISGASTTVGTFPFTFRADDSDGRFATRAFSITVNATPNITTVTLPSGTVGSVYNQAIATTGGTAPLMFTISSGSLPPGLVIGSGGVLSGTPTTPGAFPFTVRVSDSLGSIGSRSLSLSILGFSSSSLPRGKVAQVYSGSVGLIGGVPPLLFAIAAGSLPPGLSIDSSTGSITGTPTLAGSYNFTVRATDATGVSLSNALTVAIQPPDLTITTETLPNGTVNVLYSMALSAVGGETTLYRWSIQSGTLPPGLTLNSGTGAIAGTPSSAGTFRFQVLLTDGREFHGRLLSIAIDPPGLNIITDNLGPAVAGTTFTGSLSATGGSPPYRFEVIGGSLPAGLTLQSDGSITGTPTTAGNTTTRVRVTDSRGQTAVRDIGINVTSSVAPSITTRSLPPVTVGTRYDAPITASGGTPPYTFTVQSGNLPDGLSLDATGTLGGVPAAPGTFSFTIEVRDSRQQRGTQTFDVVVAPAPRITTESLAGSVTGTPYSAQVAAIGGVPPYTFSLAGGSLPDGLTLSSAGTIGGTPTRDGSFTFTVRVNDRDGRRVERSLSIAIGPVLRLTSATLPGGSLGQDYTATVAVAGGVAPYTFALASGTLPPGLSLGSNGVSGRPTTPGSYTFGIRVTDSSTPPQTATASLSIEVTAPALPTVTITGVTDTPAPATQPGIGLTLSAPASFAMTGSSTLTFRPDTGADDPNVVFSNGQRSANFLIAQGQSTAVYTPDPLGLQTGTVAGTITIMTRLFAGGVDITPTPAPARTLRIAPGPPVIVRAQLVRAGQSLQLVVTGYAPTRQVTSATVQFDPAAGASLQTSQFSVPVDQQFVAWYGSQTSAQFGSQFTLTLPFTGDANAVGAARVSLTNPLGTSNTVSAQ